MPQTPQQMEDTMIQNLEAKTGKSLGEWLRLAKAAKHERHGELVKFLKSEHGMTHGYANLIAHKTLRAGARRGRGGPGRSSVCGSQIRLTAHL
jgi:hypothetical protein